MIPGLGSLRRASSYALIGTAAQGGFRVAVNVLIGRYAGATVLGQSAGILAGAQLLTLLGPTSLGAAQTRYLARHLSEAEESARTRAGIVQHVRRRVLQVGVVIVTVAALVWGGALGATGIHLITLLALAVGLMAYGLAKSQMLGLGRIRRLALSEVTTALGGLAAVGVLIESGVRDLRLLWPVAAAAWICAGLTWVASSPGSLQVEARREIDKFSALGVIGTLVSAGFMQGSVLIGSEVIGGEKAGYYAAAFALATPLSLITTSVGMALFPEFARASADLGRTRDLMERSLGVMIGFMVPALGLVMFLTPEIIILVWGYDFGPSATLLPALICAIALSGVGMPASQALVSAGVSGMRESVGIGLVGASVGALTWALAVPAFGAEGVAVGYAIGTAITSALPLIVMGQRLEVSRLLYLLRGWIFPAAVTAVTMTLTLTDVGVKGRIASLGASITLWCLLSCLQRRSLRVCSGLPFLGWSLLEPPADDRR